MGLTVSQYQCILNHCSTVWKKTGCGNVHWQSLHYSLWIVFALSLYVGVNDFSQRSHSCGEFRPSHIGEEVKICGWVQYKRLMFLIVRDWSGTVQVLLPESMVNGLFIWCIQREDMGKKRIYDRRVYNTKWAKLKIAWA